MVQSGPALIITGNNKRESVTYMKIVYRFEYWKFVLQYMHVFWCTCERELPCAAAVEPPWRAPLEKPNEAASDPARLLHSANESLWWSPVIADMYWCVHTLEKTQRGNRLLRNLSLSVMTCSPLKWKSFLFKANKTAKAEDGGQEYSTAPLEELALC